MDPVCPRRPTSKVKPLLAAAEIAPSAPLGPSFPTRPHAPSPSLAPCAPLPPSHPRYSLPLALAPAGCSASCAPVGLDDVLCSMIPRAAAFITSAYWQEGAGAASPSLGPSPSCTRKKLSAPLAARGEAGSMPASSEASAPAGTLLGAAMPPR